MDNKRKKIIILGSTGSIGRQTLDVLRVDDDYELLAISANSSVELVLQQAEEFSCSFVALADESQRKTPKIAKLNDKVDKALRTAKAEKNDKLHMFWGSAGIEDMLDEVLPDADIVLNALVGIAGLRATYKTLKSNARLALANKESLVVGGELLMQMAKPVQILPVDSEHSAIFQCLEGEDVSKVKKLWLTASGGPFRGCDKNDLQGVTVEQALKHPTWKMGQKISIDSATMMNKGFEIIEAHHLFATPYEDIGVAVHPQSIVHSMVEYIDGSIKAHLGTTDMRIPIQYALGYPERLSAPMDTLDILELGVLSFEPPDYEVFPALKLAIEAGKAGGSFPIALNAANELAVEYFLNKKCAFIDITNTIEHVLAQTEYRNPSSIEDIEEIDNLSRLKARLKASEYLNA